MMLFGLIPLIAVVLLGAYLAKGSSRKSDGDDMQVSAYEILAQRYAAGEITEEEYRRAKRLLEESC